MTDTPARRAAPSRSCSPTSKARPGSSSGSARRATPSCANDTGPCSARRSTRHGGVEQGTEGDSFFVVFGERPEARRAPPSRRSARSPRSRGRTDAAIRVRMGLHSGEAGTAGGSLVGLDINRAARIAAAAHGGQILVSDATRALVTTALPDDVSAARPRRVPAPRPARAGAAGPGRRRRPGRRRSRRRGRSTPGPTTCRPSSRRSSGGSASWTRRGDLLDATRLLTMTGPGGTGKTRLSLQLAAAGRGAIPGRRFFVPLEPVRDPDPRRAARSPRAVGIVEGGDTARRWSCSSSGCARGGSCSCSTTSSRSSRPRRSSASCCERRRA